MTVAPEVRSFIDWSDAVNERHRDSPLPELRGVLRDELDRELQRLGVVVEDVDAVTDHEVAVVGGEIRVRVFAPPGAGPHPGFLHFHGGGFVFGTIKAIRPLVFTADASTSVLSRLTENGVRHRFSLRLKRPIVCPSLHTARSWNSHDAATVSP